MSYNPANPMPAATVAELIVEANQLRNAMKAIAACMDRKAWSADTLESIAAIVRHSGHKIREPHA